MPDNDLIPPSPKYDPNAPPAPDDAALFAEAEPFVLFERWFKEAKEREPNDPNGMALATVDDHGLPDVRMVLLKDVSAEGFVFYTNAESAKGRQLEANPRAAILFHWKSLRRQVRARGTIALVSDEEADAYFASRPVESRLGAWASPQSRVIEDRQVLDDRYRDALARYGSDPPRPSYWGGYRVVPERVEFWQGRPGRMHDRVRYAREGSAWRIERLAP